MNRTEPLSDGEKEACIALSDLFLDTESTPVMVSGMAASLHRLQLPVSQLDSMLRYEVFPILYPNLISVAGIWDHFDEADLIARINARRKHPYNVLQALGNNAAWLMLSGSVLSLWAEVKEAMRRLDRPETHL